VGWNGYPECNLCHATYNRIIGKFKVKTQTAIQDFNLVNKSKDLYLAGKLPNQSTPTAWIFGTNQADSQLKPTGSFRAGSGV
jgi:hypothetical protein